MPAQGLIIGAYGSGFFDGSGSVPRDGAALAGFGFLASAVTERVHGFGLFSSLGSLRCNRAGCVAL
jgi:hypothetical protein